MTLDTIPFDRGPLPIFGHAFAARRDLRGTLTTMFRNHGPVVHSRVLNVHMIHLFGPDAMEMGLRNRHDQFSNKLGWAHFLDHIFPGAILSKDGSDHRYHRRIMQAAFTTRALRDYVERMNPSIGIRLDDWLGDAPLRRFFPAYNELKQLTLDIATSTFMGLDVRDAQSARVNRAFVHTTEASIAMLRVDVWPTDFYKGRRGRQFLVERFRTLLADKKRQRLPDLFSQMCHAESEDGERFSDDEVIDHMIFVMMAAHDTSASTLTTLCYLLAKHPEWQERLRAQSLTLDEDFLDYDTLADTSGPLAEMDQAMCEALRLYPPLPSMPRWTLEPVEYEGYTIPKGVLVSLNPIVTHHMPELWTDPDRFDPERFSPERAEHTRHRYAWTPFGGGAHLCIGKRFAALEIKSTLHQMLRRYRWSLVHPGYVMPYAAMPISKPRDDLPIRLERL